MDLALQSIENRLKEQERIIENLKDIIQKKELKIKELKEEIKQVKEGR